MNKNGISEKPSISFTLVHGTFAKDADWVHNETDEGKFRSKIRDGLKNDYDVCFDLVNWGYSGFKKLMDNTNSRRLYGVEQLTKHLLTFDDATSINQRYIVAHSHGGNIALHALRDPDVLKKITGVICLSTPFLFYKPAIFNRSLLFFSALVLLLVALDSQAIVFLAYAVFYIAITMTILLSNKYGATEESVNNIIERAKLFKLVGKDQISGEHGQPSFLAIRPHRDEITILFSITRGFGSAFRYLWEFINRVGGWLVGAYIALGMGVRFVVEYLPLEVNISSFEDIWSQVDQLILTPMLLTVTFILSGMVILRWSYALDSIPWIAGLDIRPGITPWEGAKKEIVQTWGLIKHSNIQNQSPSIIVKWIYKINKTRNNI